MDLDVHLSAIVSRDTRAYARWMAGAESELRDSLRSFAAVVDVESVVQEALLRVWTVAPRFVADGRPNGLLRFGIRIARNLAVSEVRRTKARPVSDEDLERALALTAHSAADSTPDPLLREVIANCTKQLPDQPLRALEARVTMTSSDDELAASCSMRLNTFLKNFGRARRALAECLQKHGIVFDRGLET